MPVSAVRPDVQLAWESFGDPADPALVLIAGLGVQMLAWDERLCRLLAGGGRRVIRFDNRDCGRSSRVASDPVDIGALVGAASTGDLATVREMAPYTLADMADDVAGLLDALAIDRAHIVGASMGGMIAHEVAIRHPARTATLTSISSSTGEPDHGRSTPEAFAALMRPTEADRSTHIAAAVAAARVWSSRRYFDADEAAAYAAASFDRAYAPDGTSRQLAAMLAAGPRADALAQLDVPTLVIHGLDDTLITPSGGERTAALVPGATLVTFADMGHDRPEPLWPDLVAAILAHTAAA